LLYIVVLARVAYTHTAQTAVDMGVGSVDRGACPPGFSYIVQIQ